MRFVDNTFCFDTNLGGSCFDKLQAGTWKLGLFADNPGIENENSDTFYKDVTMLGLADDKTFRCLKNKVCCVLYDKSTVEEAHIIHWHEGGGWFCISFESD